jgi:peptidyl-prolyl cis-trans isomerase C
MKTLTCILGVLASAAPACRHDSSDVIARVDDAVITVSDVQTRINKQPPFARARYSNIAKKRELLDELVQFETLAAEAARRGYDQDPDVRRIVRQQMVSRLVQNDFESKLKAENVPDADVEKYYADHAAEFHQKDAVGVSAIFVKSKGKADRAYAEAQALPRGPANLEEQQERFRDLVTKYSDEREPESRAGDLMFFYADSTVIPKPIVETAFGLKAVGDLAPPIKTEEGWAVILLTQKRPGINRPLQEVKRQIQQHLLGNLRSKALETFVDDLRTKSHVTINDANLLKVVVDAGGGGSPGLSLPGALGAPLNAPPRR